MTNEELARLIYNGHDKYIEQLHNQVEKLIYKYAFTFYTRCKKYCMACGVEMDDLLQEAYFALLECVEIYGKDNRGYKYTTFLKYNLLNCFNAMVGRRTQKGRREPLNCAASLDKQLSEDENYTLADTLADESADFENTVVNRVAYAGIYEAAKRSLKDKPETYKILELRYRQCMSLKQISHITGHSISAVSSIIHTGLRLLRTSRKKLMIPYYNDIVQRSVHHGSFSEFKVTGNSSVEWAILNIEERREKYDSTGSTKGIQTPVRKNAP